MLCTTRNSERLCAMPFTDGQQPPGYESKSPGREYSRESNMTPREGGDGAAKVGTDSPNGNAVFLPSDIKGAIIVLVRKEAAELSAALLEQIQQIAGKVDQLGQKLATTQKPVVDGTEESGMTESLLSLFEQSANFSRTLAQHASRLLEAEELLQELASLQRALATKLERVPSKERTEINVREDSIDFHQFNVSRLTKLEAEVKKVKAECRQLRQAHQLSFAAAIPELEAHHPSDVEKRVRDLLPLVQPTVSTNPLHGDDGNEVGSEDEVLGQTKIEPHSDDIWLKFPPRKEEALVNIDAATSAQFAEAGKIPCYIAEDVPDEYDHPQPDQVNPTSIASAARHDSSLDEIANLAFDEYYFNSSIWDASIFIFLPQVGGGATFFITLSLLLLVCMLAVFVGIIVESFIEPNTFGSATQDAFRDWRNEYAHTSAYADPMRGTSLASRVCNQDRGLVTSTYQVNTVGNLQAYLPDSASCTSVSCEISEIFFTGPMLVLLSVAVWFLTVAAQARSTFQLGRAVMSVPHDWTTHVLSDGGRLKMSTMTTQRRAFAFFLVLLKLVFNLTLWGTGSSFLIHSVNLQNILLNTLALEFVLHLDELLYGGMAPLQIHGLFDNLKPIQLSSWRRIAGADAFTTVIPFILLGHLSVVWYVYLSPFVDEMKASERILCGGDVDFISKPDAAGVMWTLRTPAFGSSILPLHKYEKDSVTQVIASWSTAVAIGAIKVSEPYGESNPGVNFEHLQRVSAYRFFVDLNHYRPQNSADKGNLVPPSNPFSVYHLRQLLQNHSGSCSDILSIVSMPSCYQNFVPFWHPYFSQHTDVIIRIQALCQTGCGCHSPWFGTIFKSYGGCPGVETSAGFQAALSGFPCEDPFGHKNSTIISFINGVLMHNPEITRLGLAWPAPTSPDFCAFAYPLFKDVKSLWTTVCPATWGCKYTNLSKLGDSPYCPSSCPCNLNSCA